MQRPTFRQPPPPYIGNGAGNRSGGASPYGGNAAVNRSGGYWSPSSVQQGGNHSSGMMPPSSRGFPSSYTPPFGQKHRPYSVRSPGTPPENYYKYNSPSPGQASQRGSPRSPYSKSPGSYQMQGYSPGHQKKYQGSPRTSTPFGPQYGRDRRKSDVENYYKPSMVENPWAGLEPVSVTDVKQQYNVEQTTNTGRRGRYFS
ncbi:M-phase-specific PLK1-interacting protein [Protopterus annectens]|uniref:M-phase-specific PLK1-interacting protein n=1 Tax=Protopterus annectens TaxID=7888 RepID=UPI001CFA10E2|nr:M-phase-specific PLK1-interacting protein [Protopterus annectens]